MNDTAASAVHIVIPSQEISLHAPAVVIDLVPWLEKGELLADLALYLSVNFDFKCRKQGKQPLSDNTQFTIVSVIYMQLMS